MDAQLVLALLLLSHMVADFVWQDAAVAAGKRTCPKLMLRHASHYLLTNIIFLSPYLAAGNNLWRVVLVLAFVHWGIDVGKVNYDRHKGNQSLESFILDQAAHLFVIGGCYPLISDIGLNPAADSLAGMIAEHYPVFAVLTAQTAFSAIIIVTGYIFNFRGATVITKMVLERYLHLKGSGEPAEPKNAGEAIGNLERILVLTLVLQQNYATIGLVIAGKTLARYKKLEEKDFAEYFLIGTFTSIIAALLTGIVVEAAIRL
jgi:hypothetical protein